MTLFLGAWSEFLVRLIAGTKSGETGCETRIVFEVALGAKSVEVLESSACSQQQRERNPRMMRLLFVLAIVLTANVVSAQSTFIELPAVQEEPAVVEVINFPYTELTETRLWAPDVNSGVYQWWALTREHQGPKWQRRGMFWNKVDDVVIDRWVPGQAPEAAKPQTYQTINIWKLRDEEERKMKAQETKPSRLTEPVYRVPNTQQEQGREPAENDAPANRSVVPQKKPAPTPQRRTRATGPTMYAQNDSSGN